MIRKLLIILYIVQVHKNTKDNTKGRGYFEAYRLNPYNPLSYTTIIIVLIVAFLMFGAVGMWKEIDLRNPFKWN